MRIDQEEDKEKGERGRKRKGKHSMIFTFLIQGSSPQFTQPNSCIAHSSSSSFFLSSSSCSLTPTNSFLSSVPLLTLLCLFELVFSHIKRERKRGKEDDFLLV